MSHLSFIRVRIVITMNTEPNNGIKVLVATASQTVPQSELTSPQLMHA